jgi:hypothetical protein
VTWRDADDDRGVLPPTGGRRVERFDSFCRGGCGREVPALDDRDDLWRILVVIVYRKTSDHVR